MARRPARANKIDDLQPELVKHLRLAGYEVECDHDDLLVTDPSGRPALLWVEVKSTGGKPSEGQLAIHKRFAGVYMIVGQWGLDHAFKEITRWFARGR